jgi:hypothetical protein
MPDFIEIAHADPTLRTDNVRSVDIAAQLPFGPRIAMVPCHRGFGAPDERASFKET